MLSPISSVDSIMLLEEGYEVVSVDASDKMLKYALKERWNRRKEPAFDRWGKSLKSTNKQEKIDFQVFSSLYTLYLTVIEEANWLTLYDDIKPVVGEGFDAVICLGNSFAHLMDNSEEQLDHKQAIKNFQKCLKPRGILFIDHRNYDDILETGDTPAKSIYYNVSTNTIFK